MNSKKALIEIVQKILQHVDEGIHIVNVQGNTMYYNNAMAELEGLKSKDVLGKNLLEIFPSLNTKTSTLLQVLKTEEMITDKVQTYMNNKGKEIITINTTMPLYSGNEQIGALEIAKNITSIKSLTDEVSRLKQELVGPLSKEKTFIKKYTFDDLIGKSEVFLKAIEIARRASMSSSSVLIYGETGTGKELFAQSIHNYGNRKSRPFIAQNCAALPETLLEGILFGTSKGGFTGAIDRPGIFEQASGGTILLDEINSMGLQLQAKILRVLQEGYIRRVGGTKDIAVDLRIIATTNEEPLSSIKSGKIRKDLYYRLNVVNITLPTLVERRDDILVLVDHFINKYNIRLQKKVWMLSDVMKKRFLSYSWLGNVRELENLIEGAMNLVQEEHVLQEEHFPDYLSFEEDNSYTINLTNVGNGAIDLQVFLENIEIKHIKGALDTYKGNISKASEHLGLKRQTLQHKIKKFNLNKG